MGDDAGEARGPGSLPPRLDEVLEVLRATPGTLRGLLGSLGPHWLAADEGPGTFSPRDVLGHLIHGEETDWLPRIRIILEHGEARPFTPFDRRAFRSKHAEASAAELLDTFARLRQANLAQLEPLRLGPAELGRRGTHPELGAVTLGQLMAAWATHDLGHLAQVARAMAGRCRQSVGPWRAYLGILGR